MSQTVKKDTEAQRHKYLSFEHTQVLAHNRTRSLAHWCAIWLQNKKKPHGEHLNHFAYCEKTIICPFLSTATHRWKGKVHWDNRPTASWSCRTDTSRAHSLLCKPNANPRYFEFTASSFRAQACISTNEWSQSENQSCGKGYIWPSLPTTAVKH